jgi:hypothetical protein
VLSVQTEPSLCGGKRLIVRVQHGIPNGDCAAVIGEEGLVIEAGRLHTGQSIQLKGAIISHAHPSTDRCPLPVTLELDDGCSIAYIALVFIALDQTYSPQA